MHFPHRVLSTSLRAVAVRARLQIRFKDRLNDQLDGGLHHAVPNSRNSQRSLPSARLRNHHPPNRFRSIRLFDQFLLYLSQPSPPPCRLNPVKRLVVHPGSASVGFCQFVCVRQNVLPQDLVVERVESITGLLLRFRV
jgi:hypothetical protein